MLLVPNHRYNIYSRLRFLANHCSTGNFLSSGRLFSFSHSGELACTYATLILHDDAIPVTNQGLQKSLYPKEKMSICTSFRQISSKFPLSLPNHKPKTLKTIIISPVPISQNLFLLRPITIDRLPLKPLASSPSSSSLSLQAIEELPPTLQEIVKLFQGVKQPKAKYEQLLFYGKNLTPLDPKFKTVENKVQGCVSQVWVRAYHNNKNVFYEADSDSALTKGLAALLVKGLSGRPVEEILQVSPDFIALLRLQQSLTPSRNSGFLNMLKLMQRKALQLFVENEKNSNSGEEKSFFLESGVDEKELEVRESNEESIGDSESDSGDDVELGNRGNRMKEILKRELSPTELEVEDISYQHAGHAGVRGSDGETHFNVKIVSNKFEGKSLVKRHRMIYGLLQDELESGLHALSIVAKTPSEV